MRRRALLILLFLLSCGYTHAFYVPHYNEALFLTEMAPEPRRISPRATAACGRNDYVACPDSAGGGCCPSGYLCGSGECSPPPIPTIEPCPGVFFSQCSAALGGGCCSVGYECGVQGCLITHSFPKTVLLLTTDTTTINGIPTVVVATSASGTTGRETGTSPKWRATMTATVVEKATTTVYATPAAVAAELGAPAIAGIAGGVVGFLVLLAGAGVLLARHLRGMSRLIEAQLRQQEGAPPEDGGKGAQGAGWTLSDEPHELDPFDKLGELPDRKFLSHELMGSPDGHGVSELDVAPGLEAGDYAAEKEIQVWEK